MIDREGEDGGDDDVMVVRCDGEWGRMESGNDDDDVNVGQWPMCGPAHVCGQ